MEQLRDFVRRVRDRVLNPLHHPERYMEPTLATSPPLTQNADLIIRAIDLEVTRWGFRNRETEHLLAALAPNEITRSGEYELARGPAIVLSHFGITKGLVHLGIDALLGKYPQVREQREIAMQYFEGVRAAGVESIRTTPGIRRVLDLAEASAKTRGAENVDSLDLLKGLLDERERLAAAILEDLGVDLKLIEEGVNAVRDQRTWEDFVYRVLATSPLQSSIDRYHQMVRHK